MGTILRYTAVCTFLVLSVLPFAGAMADKADLSVKSAREPIVNIMLGKAEMVTLASDISDVLVANPGIVDVMAVKANQLYLVGSALGDTNIMALDEEGNVVRKINVHVQMDTEKLEDMLVELYPDETVKVRALTDQVVLTGNVSTPAVSNSVANLVAQYAAEIQGSSARSIDDVVVNMLTVTGEQQVMLKVKIIEASRSALKDLGIETNLQNADSGNWTGTIGTAAALGLTAPQQLGVFGLNFLTDNFGPLRFVGRALEEEGILNTLAEPNLTAISGEQAGFLAGGEIPIPTQIDRNGNLVYEFRPFGVSLNFRPTVMSANRISMQMTTEISSTSFEDNLQLNGINIPSFSVRRAQTTVELPSGGTLMIAGLIQSDSISGLTQIPGVKDVPVVGDLMKSDTFQRNESEVIVMVTPYLVKPFAQNNAAPAPGPVPVDTSNAPADLNTVPRLSMEDLQEIPEDGSAPKKIVMAPPTGLSRQKMLADTPLAPSPPQPERSKSALNHTYENNLKRTYGTDRIETVTKELGSFGYIID